MNFIKNFDALASTPERKIVLDLVNAAFESIQPHRVIDNNVKLDGNTLVVKDKQYNLAKYNNIFLIGFGKGSAGISQLIEKTLGDHLVGGYVIDTVPPQENFQKIEFTQGTHPLPSQENYDFTKKLTHNMRGLSEHDLVLVVICGGGSAMLVSPNTHLKLEQKIEVNKALLHSGADIIEMNTVRKHLSAVKGGGFAKILYPAHITSLIFSDVPGNDLAFIASGPTVKDNTTTQDALAIIEKYELIDKLPIKMNAFTETPKESKYFEHVHNILMLSNLTALDAMRDAAAESGYSVRILSDKTQGYANEVGKMLIDTAKPGQILLSAGESTVKVTGQGTGGRNQQLVLSVLKDLDDKTTICSFDSDGWDNTTFAGAIGSQETLQKAKEKNVSVDEYLKNNDSTPFFEKIEDGINTGRLPSNVSDLMIVLKK